MDMQVVTTGDLVLEPLVVAHAEAMFDVLNDPVLYRYLDYPGPPSLTHLRGVYERLQARTSPDGSQQWLNWVIRPHGQAPIGYVQATVTAHRSAWIAYVLATGHWGRGHATQAVRAMLEHLAAAYGVRRCLATVEAANGRSIRLLERLGFRRATEAELRDHDLSRTEYLFVRDAGAESAR